MIPLIFVILLTLIAVIINTGLVLDDTDLTDNNKLIVNSITLIIIMIAFFYLGTL